MPSSSPAAGTDRVGAATVPDRDRAVDLVRVGSLLVVVFGHCALLLATIDDRGVRIGNLLGAVPALAPVTWIVQVMPLFFLAGGAAGGYGYRAGTPWGRWLFTRAQRLCRPVFWYLGVAAVALLVARATLGAPSAQRLGSEVVALLWFLGIYLVALAAVPTLTRLRSGRAAALVVAALLAGAAAFDAVRVATGEAMAGLPNFGLVWLIPVVIGVAYARRLVPAGPALAAAVGLFVGQVLLATFGPYDVSLVVTGTARMSNVGPPTLLLGLHATVMACLFVAAAGALRRVAERRRIARLVSAGNGGAMTLYLWHIPAIAVAALALHAAQLDAYDVDAPGFWPRLALRAVVFAAVMAVLFVALRPVEHRRLPWWDAAPSAAGAQSVAAGVLVCAAGLSLVGLAATGLGSDGGNAALAGFLAAAAGARLCAGNPVKVV